MRAFVAGRAAQALATVAVTLLAVRLLDAAAYGQYMVVWGLVELGVPLTSLGLLPAAQRYLPELATSGSPQALRQFVRWIYWARTGTILLACAAVAFGWETLAGWIGVQAVAPAVPWLAAGLLFCVLRMRFAAEMLEAMLEQRYAQTVRALLPAGRALCLLVIWQLESASLHVLLAADLAVAAAAWVLAEVWLAQRLRSLQPGGSSAVAVRDLLSFVWHMSGAQLMNAVASVGTLRLIVARALGVEAAGAFAFMQQLVVIGNRYLPSVLLANLVRPMLIDRHTAGSDEAVGHGLGLLWKLNFALVWPLVALAALYGSPLVATLSGGRILDGGPTMAWLMLGLGALAQAQIVTMAMQIYRYTALARRVSMFALLVPPLALFAAGWGLPAVAAAYALALWLRGLVGLAWLKQQPHGLYTDWPGVARVAAALAVACAAGWAAGHWGGHWVGSLVLGGVYIGLCIAARPLMAQEFDLVGRGLGRKGRWLRVLVRRSPGAEE